MEEVVKLWKECCNVGVLGRISVVRNLTIAAGMAM